jgi:hypothetical protein
MALELEHNWPRNSPQKFLKGRHSVVDYKMIDRQINDR